MALSFAILVAFLEGGGVDHVGEAVAVAVLEIFQIEAVGLAEVGQSEGNDRFAANIGDRTFDFAGNPEEPFGIEAFGAGVHALDDKMLRDAAVAVDIASQLIGLKEDQVLQETNDLPAFALGELAISPARVERFAGVPANDGFEIEAGAVMAIRSGGAHAPQGSGA